MRVATLIIFSLLLSGCSMELLHPTSLPKVEQAIHREFPDVNRISTEQLALWMRERSPLLLDVREKDEYRVSHLYQARRVEPGSHATALLDVEKDRLIVTYCSVGYRSARFAQRLQRAGYSNVYNLDGSIFRWANEGRPVYQGELRVQEVHPYSATWGRLLDAPHFY
jgi:rhodanese-related sulfurtransferase